mgnify:CR=1 FL=1
MKYINKKLSIEKIKVEDIAKKFGTPTYCYSYKRLKDNINNFKNFVTDDYILYEVGKAMSATEFIRVHRVKNASELLKNKELAISEICFACGFENTSYFSKQFKIVFGCSPKDYRKTL